MIWPGDRMDKRKQRHGETRGETEETDEDLESLCSEGGGWWVSGYPKRTEGERL